MVKISTILFFIMLIASCQNEKTRVQEKDFANPAVQKKQKTEKDYFDLGEQLIKNEKIGILHIGMKYDELLNVKGEPEEISKPEFSEVDGLYYQTFDYKSEGLTLGIVINNDSTKEVSWIEIKQPCDLKTSKSVGIGSSFSDVGNAYRAYIDPQYMDSSSLICGSVYGGIFVDFLDGKVNKLYLGYGAD